MDIYEVVTKLTGPIKPVGETHTDNMRFENLKTMCDLAEKLLRDIDEVATYNKSRHEYSMCRAGKYADEFLTNQGIAE